ncbi:hypothetical protein K1719_020901 [Acacia pycnantha]|nr:hypothetical protein K1719_020901 [Acacia pycnantha]
MAASSMISSPTFSPTAQIRRHSLASSPSAPSFHDIRPLTTKENPIFTQKRTTTARRGLVVKAELNPSVVISLSTGLLLFLGRLVIKTCEKHHLPTKIIRRCVLVLKDGLVP